MEAAFGNGRKDRSGPGSSGRPVVHTQWREPDSSTRAAVPNNLRVGILAVVPLSQSLGWRVEETLFFLLLLKLVMLKMALGEPRKFRLIGDFKCLLLVVIWVAICAFTMMA